jgi:hypothetical protein
MHEERLNRRAARRRETKWLAIGVSLIGACLTPHEGPARAARVTAIRRGDVMNTVIFACIQNAGRSQMAAAWFNALADSTRVRAVSAGTEPGTRVHPEVLERSSTYWAFEREPRSAGSAVVSWSLRNRAVVLLATPK